ncbi:hypothetical protein BDV18DRAFT_156173 [Aspergillus unguis]
MAVVPGLLFAVTKPFDPSLTDAEFNDWYNNKHIVDVVNCGLASNGFRYKNRDASAEWPHLALYRLPHLPKLYDPAFMSTVPTDSPKSWNAGYMPDVARAELRGYQQVKTYEPKNSKDGSAKVVVTAEIQGTGESEFLPFLEKEHLAKVQGLPGYRRTILCKSAAAFVPKEGKTKDDPREGTDFETAKEQRLSYLTVHEFDQAPSPADLPSGVEVWDYVAEYGTGLARIEPTHGRR